LGFRKYIDDLALDAAILARNNLNEIALTDIEL
jgi:hypothetical protein